MQRQGQPRLSFFLTLVLLGITAVLITLAAIPVSGQNPVPSNAVEAAKSPQFAAKLAHPAHTPALLRRRPQTAAPQGGIVYDNGPINGSIIAWTINFGFVVSDSMTITNATNATGMSFGAWLFPGDVMETAEISITSQPNGGISYFDQNVSFTQSNCSGNRLGYNVCSETSQPFQSSTLQPGTYWVNLQNAQVSTGDPVSWDQNDGPSVAYDSSVGTIPSESFTMLGDNTGPPQCFSSQGNLQVLYSFTQSQRGGNGVVLDQAGNLYGSNALLGNNGDGLVFKLARFTGWMFDSLFNFSGGSNGDQPSGVIVGPNGSLYGGAQGGIQNCNPNGSEYCGLVFNLRPRLKACPTTQCGWNEYVLYRFTNETDGAGAVNISAYDQHGNLYGVTYAGGAFDAGTVFELSQSGGAWTKTTLYTFTGQNDGYGPTQVLLGHDGNLYGLAQGGANGGGVVFQLTMSGGHWTQSVIHSFKNTFGIGSLLQDEAGNLYGSETLFPDDGIFTLQKTGASWTYSEYLINYGDEYDHITNLAIDATGNVYGTGSGGTNIFGSRGNPSPGGGQVSYDAYIFKAAFTSGGWQYTTLNLLGDQLFPTSGALAIDSGGNLYGTTTGCGANESGTVWQLSP